jgi:formate hydrogenlyase transcriptional activator
LEALGAQKESIVAITVLQEVERDHIVRALDASNWVVGGRSGAAERLGMKRTSLVYKIKKLRIRRPVLLPKSVEGRLCPE